MANSVKIAIAVMLVIHLTRSNAQSPNIEFLNKLIENKLTPIETMVIIQHHLDRNCELREWNRQEIPTLRLNQLARVVVRRHFNSVSLGIVCIGKDSDLSLVDYLAKVFDGMRQERIILWVQKEVSLEMLQRITHQAKLNQYLQVLILEVSVEQGEILRAHRFLALPNSQIAEVDKLDGFPKIVVDFTGRTANVLPEYETFVPAYGPSGGNLSTSFQWQGNQQNIILFARKYNLNLKVIPSPRRDRDPSALNVTPEIRLASQLTSSKMDVKYLNPFDLAALKVVVPCSRMRTIADILKQLDIKSSLLYILPVYAIFVAVETIILLVAHRILGRAYQLTSLNPLLNLRAFGAILGQSFPVSRRANPSLRQLFFAISVFGLIFSNFFSCKLTALLTRHSYYPQVTNFHELRASGLSVVVNTRLRAFIENEIDKNFFNKTVIRVNTVTTAEKSQLLLSLSDSNAFVVSSDYWSFLGSYQKSLGRKVLCDSKDLTIMQGIPKMHVLEKNSIYYWPLSKFLIRIHEAGINTYWTNQSPRILLKLLNVTLVTMPGRMEAPLRIADLNWLWLLLGCGYGLATFVFIIELMLRGRGKRDKAPEPMGNALLV